MDALNAPLLHVQRSDALWLIPAAPLIGAIARRALLADEAPKRPLLTAVTPIAIALLIAGSQVFGLLSLDADARHLLAPGWSAIGVGSFEATLGLAFDPLSAVFAVVVAMLGLAAHAHAVWIDEHREPWAIDVAVAGALLSVLSDGFLGALIGAGIAALAIARVANRGAPLAGVGAGSAALTLGAVLLFWTLGGSWGISLGLEPTYTRRNPAPANLATMDPLDADDPVVGPSLLPVVIGGAPPASSAAKGAIPDVNAKGHVTVAGVQGARVYLKGTMEPSGTTPMIRHELYAGRVDVEIERSGDRRQHFRAVEIPANREVAFVTIGPTWNFRELREQLILSDAAHRRFVRDLLDPALTGHRRLGRYDAVTLVMILFAAAAAAPLVAGIATGSSLLVEVLASLVAVYLLARLGFLFALTANATAAAAVVFALVALFAALRATVDHLARAIVARVLAAQLAIAALGVAIGLPSLGVLHAFASVCAAAIAVVILDGVGVRGLRRVSALADSAPAASRVLRVAAIALVGAPVPFLGAGFTRESILGRLFVAEVPFAKVAFGVALLATAAMTYATYRAVYLVCEGPGAQKPLDDADHRVTSALMLVAAAVALVVPIVGWSRAALFGFGAERSALDALLHPVVDPASVLGPERAARFADAGKGAELGAIGLLVAAAIAAWAFARKKFAREDRAAVDVFEPPRVAGLAALPRAFTKLDDLLFARPLGIIAGLLVRVIKR